MGEPVMIDKSECFIHRVIHRVGIIVNIQTHHGNERNKRDEYDFNIRQEIARVVTQLYLLVPSGKRFLQFENR
jgi:hypothetical protein